MESRKPSRVPRALLAFYGLPPPKSPPRQPSSLCCNISPFFHCLLSVGLQTSIINLILPLYLLDSGFFFISYSALNTTDADFNADQTYSDVIVIRLLSIAKMSFRGDRTEPWLAGVDDRYSYYNLPTVLPIRDNEEHDPAVRLSAPSTSAAQGESFTQGHREPSPASLAGSESWDEVECYCSMCERAQEDADEIAQRNFETGRVYLRDGQDYLESSQRDLQDSETHIEDGTEQFSDGDEVDWDAVPRNVEYDGGNGLIYDDEEIISYVDDGERSPYYGPHSEDEADGMDYAEDGERSPDNGPRPEEDGENDMYEEDSSYYEDPAVRDERIEANYNAFSSQWNVVNWEAGARRPVEPPVSPMTRLAARFDETTNSFYGEDSPGHSSDSSNSSVVFLWESPANSQENLRERPALMSNSPKQESSQTPVSSESGDSDFKTSIAKKRKREASCEIVFEFKRNVRPRST